MLAPVLFISHGAPTLVIDPVPAREFLTGLSSLVPRPSAIVVVSAHWREREVHVGMQTINETIHDFGGFPDALYQLKWPAPGNPALAQVILERLEAAGIPAQAADRGLDHGAWVPLSLAWPAADIPVVPVSLTFGSIDDHLRLGAVLGSFRDQGVLVVGSGASTHPLAAVVPNNDQPPRWVAEFDTWLSEVVQANDLTALRAWRQAPEARRVHPTDEHLLPLMVAMGAAGAHHALTETPHVQRLHHSWTWHVLAMDCWKWD